MHQKRRSPRNIRLQHAHAGIRRVPALHHHIVQLIAQELIHHAFILPIHLQKVRQRPHRRHSVRNVSGICLEDIPHRVGRVAVLPDQRIQRTPPSLQGGPLRAQHIAPPPHSNLVRPRRIDLLSQLRNPRLQRLQPLGHVAEGHLHLATLQSQLRQLAPRCLRLRKQPLRFALQCGPRGLSLCLLVLACRRALHQLHCSAPILLRLLLRRRNRTHCLLRPLLLGLRRLARSRCLRRRILQKTPLGLQFTRHDAKLLPRLLQIVAAGRDACSQLGHAVGIGSHARRHPLQLHRTVVRLRTRLTDLLVELIPQAHASRMLGVHRLHFSRL